MIKFCNVAAAKYSEIYLVGGALGAKDSATCKNGSGNTAMLWYKKKTSRVTIGARLSYANN